VFPIAPRFNPICFAQSCPSPSHLNRWAKGGGTPSSILGNLHSFNFFFQDGPIELAHCNQKKEKKLDL
jgi:hypothetical protein